MKRFSFLLIFILISKILVAQTDEIYFVSSQHLNLRNGQGPQYKSIGMLSNNDQVTLLEKGESGWWLVDFEGRRGYVFSKYLVIDPYKDWEATNYESGTAPPCFNINPMYDYEIDNYLRVKVGSGTDVVIKLMKKGFKKDQCIRIFYVRSKETYEIKNIPEGRYYLKIAYGRDYRKKIVDGVCYIKFFKNAQYEKGTDILDFNLIKLPDKQAGDSVYERWDIPCFELSLDVIKTSRINQELDAIQISEEEFNY